MSKYYSHGMTPYVYNWPGRAYPGSRVNGGLSGAFEDITGKLREAGKALTDLVKPGAPGFGNIKPGDPAAPVAQAPAQAGSSNGLIFGLPIAVVGIAAIGGAIYLKNRKKGRK